VLNKDNELIKSIAQIAGKSNILINEPMAAHTTFKVGGPADIYVTPASVKALTSALNLCLERNLAYFVIGKGSNLIVSDKGIRSVVISTQKLTYVRYKDNLVSVGCGFDLWKLSNHTAERGLSGLEFACGIPGSVGGAVYMNAGAYEGEISKVLVLSEVLAIDDSDPAKPFFRKQTLDNEEHGFSYRHSVLQDKNYIHLNSVFALSKCNKRLIKSELKRLTLAREEKQPLELPSAGSVFRRPEGYFVGKLIQDCGLKGFRIGDAAISTKHCGFIVNLGKATAKDILALIEHIRNRVLQRFGVTLQTEVKFIGEK